MEREDVKLGVPAQVEPVLPREDREVAARIGVYRLRRLKSLAQRFRLVSVRCVTSRDRGWIDEERQPICIHVYLESLEGLGGDREPDSHRAGGLPQVGEKSQTPASKSPEAGGPAEEPPMRRTFAAMMTMRKIDVAAIDVARRG